MNKRSIGRGFERKCLSFLENKFDKVEWLSDECKKKN